MSKTLYISILILIATIAVDIFSFKSSDPSDSVEKLKIYINDNLDLAKKTISLNDNLLLLQTQKLNSEDLSKIKALEKYFRKRHISLKIRQGSSLIAWLNNKDHNTICKSYQMDSLIFEICLNPFDADLKVFSSVNNLALLSHGLELTNPGKDTYFLFDKHVRSYQKYRSENLNNVLLITYFLIFIFLIFYSIIHKSFLGLFGIIVARAVLFILSDWHTRYDNSIFLERLILNNEYCTLDLLFDSTFIFLFLAAYSISQFIKVLPNKKQLFVFIHSIFIALLIVSHIRLIQILSFNGAVDLSINDLSKIGLTSIIVFISILLIQAGIFVYAVSFIKKLKSDIKKKSLYLSLIFCSVSSTLLAQIFQLDINIWLIFLFFLLFFMLLDLFIDVKLKSITWIIWWAIFFGIYLSALLFNYDIKREIKDRSQQLENIFTDVNEFEIEKVIKSNELRNINSSLAELLILPEEANYDKADILNYIQKKHNKTNIKIDISDKEGYFYFHEWPDSFLLQKITDNYFFDQVHNVLWYLDKGPNELNLHTGIELKTIQSQTIPFVYIVGEHLYNKEFDLSDRELEKINATSENDFYYNSNVYIRYDLGNAGVAFSKKSFNTIVKPVALFSFLFSLIIILILTLGFVSHWISFLAKSWPYNIKNIESLNSKIQIALILVILLSFILIAFITSSFLKSFIDNKNEEYLTEKLESLSRDINSKVRLASSISEAFTIGTNYQKQFEQTHGVELVFNSFVDKEFQENYFPFAYFSKYKNATAFSDKNIEGHLISYLPFRFKNETLGFVKISNRQNDFQGLNVFDFLGSIFNVYVFLFLIASVLAIFIARSITRPLSMLNQKLSQLKLGKRNELIRWDREDEIGTLIANYNTMVKELESSAELLAKTERDSAWREMAKQVAHEIKNPLTPMKMYIQHLEKAVRQKPNEAVEISKKISATLLEQVENLTQIADSFSNFAELPQSSNEKIELNSVVELVHNLFRKRDDMEIKLSEPIDTIFVHADKNQLIRILNNLVKNAIEAIPKERKGKIHLSLYTKNEKAFIEICDNGVGISDDMKNKVFQPKFTTKDSGSGLGLAIALNMIESMNGRLYFETNPKGGTCFYIELDVIRESFSDEKERIILE